MHDGGVSRSAEALWRAIAIFRFASLGYAALLLGVNNERYSRPGWAWAVIAAMTAWTVFSTFGYAHRHRRTAVLLSADLAVTVGLLLSTFALQLPDAQRAGVMPITATWVAGPVLAWAVRYGRRAGATAALILGACDFALRSGNVGVVLNGEVLLLLAGATVGHVARLADELEAQREHADRVEAASRERERLARNIHDSVLQVLALVARRGAEAGGAAAEIGRPAGSRPAGARRDGAGHRAGPGRHGSRRVPGPGQGLGPACPAAAVRHGEGDRVRPGRSGLAAGKRRR
jgi:signal transduction histidine kinase